MAKFRVGDEVLIVYDGAWNGTLDYDPVRMLDHNLCGLFAKITGFAGNGDYILELEESEDRPFRQITMCKCVVDGNPNDHLTMFKPTRRDEPTSPKQPVKSDGGSSSYYDIPLPGWLVDKLCQRREDGQAFIKTEELIEVGFGNDFDFGNVLKSLVRAWGVTKGAGKEGNGLTYEMNKVRYSADKIESVYGRDVDEPNN